MKLLFFNLESLFFCSLPGVECKNILVTCFTLLSMNVTSIQTDSNPFILINITHFDVADT